jgi:hypothetical protein
MVAHGDWNVWKTANERANEGSGLLVTRRNQEKKVKVAINAEHFTGMKAK